jgi:hypothetical protein
VVTNHGTVTSSRAALALAHSPSRLLSAPWPEILGLGEPEVAIDRLEGDGSCELSDGEVYCAAPALAAGSHFAVTLTFHWPTATPIGRGRPVSRFLRVCGATAGAAYDPVEVTNTFGTTLQWDEYVVDTEIR